MIKKTLIKALIWIFLAGNLFFGSFGVVSAAVSPVCKSGLIDIDMQTIYRHQRSQGSYSVCIDNSAYNPGEPINISVDLYNTGMPVCGNLVNWEWVEIRATINGQTIDLIEPQWHGSSPFVSGSGTILSPNAPGNYDVVVDIIINIGYGGITGIYREIIPYTVTGTACVPYCPNDTTTCSGDHYDGGCGPLSCTGTKDCSGGPCVLDCTRDPNVCDGVQYDSNCPGVQCTGTKPTTYMPVCTNPATGNVCSRSTCQQTIKTYAAVCTEVANGVDIFGNTCGTDRSAALSVCGSGCVETYEKCPSCAWLEVEP